MCLGIPGKIVRISGDDPLYRMGTIDFNGVRKEASLAYVPEAREGDYAVVHAGFAISLIDEAEANQVFDYLKAITESDSPAGSAS